MLTTRLLDDFTEVYRIIMADPGKGIRNSRTTTAFRVVNFELFAKPVSTK